MVGFTKDFGSKTKGKVEVTRGLKMEMSIQVTMSKAGPKEKERGPGQIPKKCMRASGTRECATV